VSQDFLLKFFIFPQALECITGKIATGINFNDGYLPPVSTTPAVSLPTVSMALVANNGNNISLLTP
jgi:hypothetical protein